MNWLSGLWLVLWFAVLSIGLRVDATELPSTLWGSILYVMSATITNVGLLSILASLIGHSDNHWDAIKRGFAIYVMLISGVAVLFTESISDPTQQQYGKIAGTISLVSLVCGYRPELFDDFLSRVATIFRGQTPPN